MRRLLTFFTTAILVLMSLGIGLFTADLPFWRRAIDLPLTATESFVPTVGIGDPHPGGADALEAGRNSIDPAALEAVAERARAAGAEALLVMHRGELQLERYYTAGVHPSPLALRPADFLARPLATIAIGIAQADGSIESLDTPVARWLTEWRDDARGAITLRQLLNETSGLETGADAAAVLGSRPFADLSRLPRFATSRGVRLLLGNDFESTALGFELEHEPGGFFNVSPVNVQLAAIVVERATGLDYEKFLADRLHRLAPFAGMEAQMDRRSGMPAAHCCLRATARDALRFAEFLRNDGESVGRDRRTRLWPAGWVAEMRKGSRANPQFGLQLQRLEGVTPEVWHLGSGKGGGAWIVPEAGLSIVVLARRDISTPLEIVEPLLASPSDPIRK
jgi:CubicO group peptidase (beta-lactamase class C family)